MKHAKSSEGSRGVEAGVYDRSLLFAFVLLLV